MASNPNEGNMDEQNRDNRLPRSISGIISPTGLYPILEDVEMEDCYSEHVQEDSLSIDLNTVTMSDTSSEDYDYKPPLYTRKVDSEEQYGKRLNQRAQSWHGATAGSGLSREEEEAFRKMIMDLDEDDAGDQKHKDPFGMQASPSHAFGGFGAASGMTKGSSDYGLSREEEKAFCKTILDLDKGEAGDKKHEDPFGMEAGPSHAFGRFGAASGRPMRSAVPRGGEDLLDEPDQQRATSSAALSGKKKKDGSGKAPK